MPILELNNITKTFGGLVALSKVSFAVDTGNITGLIGPNGAGKTTLFNVIAGVLQSDTGEIIFDNQKISGLTAHVIAQKGLARTFQLVRLFKNMTVLENVMCGTYRRTHAGIISSMLGVGRVRSEEIQTREWSMEILEFLGIEKLACLPAGGIPFGQQRIVEVARALAAEPKLLLLDEPAAGLNSQETEALKEVLRKLIPQGLTLLVVEHNVKFIMDLCQEIVVLDYGEMIASGKPQEIASNQKVIDAYLGKGYSGVKN
ncbi:MAG: ABC transporter ATP-binding protein [Eubacteriales bacterium]